MFGLGAVTFADMQEAIDDAITRALQEFLQPTIKYYFDEGVPTSAPTYQTAGAAGLDLVSLTTGYLDPGDTVKFPTGLHIELPHGYEAQVRSRGSVASRGVMVANQPGTVDSDYRGEVIVLLHNGSKELQKIFAGDRIAQLIIAPVCQAVLVQSNTLTSTMRDDGAFGSTGK